MVFGFCFSTPETLQTPCSYFLMLKKLRRWLIVYFDTTHVCLAALSQNDIDACMHTLNLLKVMAMMKVARPSDVLDDLDSMTIVEVRKKMKLDGL
jgi:hypothetical protein